MIKFQTYVRVFLALIATGLILAACSSPGTLTDARHPLLQQLKQGVPHISISTDNGQPIESKAIYASGMLDIDGGLDYESYTGPMQIRGRGNSTWTAGLREGKKPYRIRLESEAAVLGLPAERNWILLANYLDGTLMGNVIAFATAHLLEMPFTQHMIPVEVSVNGEYMGSYLFTEHKEVKPNRIDIGDNDVLLELDSHFDEPFQFKSDIYALPVMIQHPNLEKMPEPEADAVQAQIMADFSEFEQALAGAESVDDLGILLDRQSLARFMIVFQLSANRELNWPRSVYMYRTEGGPYRMGPVWDFDWAYGYNSSHRQHFVNPRTDLLLGSSWTGGTFFQALMDDVETSRVFQMEWEAFYEQEFPVLLDYIKEYAAITRDAYSRDYDAWHTKPEQFARSSDFDAELERILNWMEARAEYINELVADM